ncbi:MAG: tripartite tricarboxylate transporter TctB family protein [bacterium]|nr:tripartite tricarboxylate transporter TctB family protein [bacterium]MDT8365165.1 tripartite tricarboxylate transporter TctB family protein [bacterium]
MTDRLTGGLLLVLSLGYAYQAKSFDVGFMADPIGPKAFPLIIAAFMFLISLYLIFKPDPEPEWPVQRVWVNKGLVLLSFVLYAYALVPLGFLLSTTLQVTFLAFMFKGKIWKGLAAAVAASLILYSIFVFLLGIPLPVGKIFGG